MTQTQEPAADEPIPSDGTLKGVAVIEAALLTMPTSEIAKLTSTKPLSLAMEEIANGDVAYERVKDSYK